jgi:hypothetical protein
VFSENTCNIFKNFKKRSLKTSVFCPTNNNGDIDVGGFDRSGAMRLTSPAPILRKGSLLPVVLAVSLLDDHSSQGFKWRRDQL